MWTINLIIKITNNFWRNLQSYFSTIFIPDFIYQVSSSTILHLKWCNESFYTYILSKQNKIVEHIPNSFTVPCEKSKIVSLPFSIMKNEVVCPGLSRFPVKLICCIAFGSASNSCSYLKSIGIILKYFLK